MSGVSKGKTILERLWEKSLEMPCPSPILKGNCFVWQGRKSTKGYGRICVKSREEQVHRVAYEVFGFVIPEGKQLDHLCRVRACWNPLHLDPVTNKENVLRGVGPTAQFAKRDKCKNGHSFTTDNVIMRTGKRSGRRCLTCRKQWNERRDRRKSNAL